MFLKKPFFSATEQQTIVAAIGAAELNTSGEIRVHIEKKCAGEAIHNATKAFVKLKMHETQLRNGVLFYLATGDRKFAIIGDEGINNVVPDHFWDTIKELMEKKFRDNLFVEGLCEGITLAGEQLKKHFPYQSGDKNELSNDVSFG